MGVRPLGQIPPEEDKSSQTWFDGEGEDSDLYVSSAERYRDLVSLFAFFSILTSKTFDTRWIRTGSKKSCNVF